MLIDVTVTPLRKDNKSQKTVRRKSNSYSWAVWVGTARKKHPTCGMWGKNKTPKIWGKNNNNKTPYLWGKNDKNKTPKLWGKNGNNKTPYLWGMSACHCT